MANFNPANAYWFVAGDETKVFSSATGGYVDPSSPAFLSFIETGGAAARIANEQELGEVLAQHRVRPIAPTVLDAYKDAQSVELTLAIVAKILFQFANEIRVLKGQQAITPAQFRNWVKDQM